MITRKLVNATLHVKVLVAALVASAVRLHGAALDRSVEKAFVKHDKLAEQAGILRQAARNVGLKADEQWRAADDLAEAVALERVSLGLYV